MASKNFKLNANNIKAINTFTEFNHPPDLGNFFNKDGNNANKVKGRAKANEYPNIPAMGLAAIPCEASIRILPTMGPVHENETTINVNAIKNTPNTPPFSACLSAAFTTDVGKTSSNIPKNDKAKTKNIRKNKRFGIQWLLKTLPKFEPIIDKDTNNPISV